MAAELTQLGKFPCYTTGKFESEFIYKEIFEKDTYDISNLPEEPFVVDAGANIGLFSLFVKEKYPSAKILAFEPAPQTYDSLCRNLALNKINDVRHFNYGLSSKAGIMPLTFYPSLPGNSTLHPEDTVRMRDISVAEFGQERTDALFAAPQKVDVKLERLSHFLNDYPDVKSIDLLKVDVEGAELEVLQGVDDAHWALVRYVVVESFDDSKIQKDIEDLLKSKGFNVTSELTQFDLWIITARRDGDSAPQA